LTTSFVHTHTHTHCFSILFSFFCLCLSLCRSLPLPLSPRHTHITHITPQVLMLSMDNKERTWRAIVMTNIIHTQTYIHTLSLNFPPSVCLCLSLSLSVSPSLSHTHTHTHHIIGLVSSLEDGERTQRAIVLTNTIHTKTYTHTPSLYYPPSVCLSLYVYLSLSPPLSSTHTHATS